MDQQRRKEIWWLLKEKYGGIETPDFFLDAERIKKGEPVDYIIGFVNFLDCKIDLSKKPFIPRPETEFWVEKTIQQMLGNEISDNRSSKFRRNFGIYALGPQERASEGLSGNLLPSHSFTLKCLDVFSGSGCIGIAILKHVPFAKVDFAEKEKKFCEQIKINAKLNGINPKRYKVIRSDIFSNIKGQYDFIFANPPYIAESRKNKVQPSVLKYEPKGALFAGKDGLKYVRKFLKEAKKHLNPGGKIYMEFDSFQKSSIAKITLQLNFCMPQFFRDQYEKWRFAILS